MDLWLAETIAGYAASPALLFAVLFLLTFVQEDAVSVTAGLLAGRMLIDPLPALATVVAGTIAGDVALYAAGRWLADTGPVARLRTAAGPLEARLRQQGLFAVAAARFVPGTRLPVFLASGVVGTPLAASTLVIAITTLAWTPGLFYLGYGAGEHVLEKVTPWSGASVAALLALVWLAPKLVRHAAAVLKSVSSSVPAGA
jgi:membrane protein DedA with SNARE-associated domain